MNGLYLLLASLIPGSGQEPLVAAAPHVRLGEVNANKPLEQVFHLENTGNEPISILNVSRTCACQKQELEHSILPPGAKTTLRVTYQLLTQPEGPGKWDIEVSYSVKNQEQKRVLPLSVSAKVVKNVWVEPVSLVMIGEESLSGTVRVFDRRGKPLTVTGTRLGISEVTSKIVSGNGERHLQQTIDLTVSEALKVGTYVDELSIDTDDPEYREVRIPVRLIKKAKVSSVRAIPERVKLVGPASTKLIRLSDPQEREIEIDRLEIKNGPISAKWVKGPDNDATIRVTAQESPTEPEGITELIVTLKQPTVQRLVIPVEWKK